MPSQAGASTPKIDNVIHFQGLPVLKRFSKFKSDLSRPSVFVMLWCVAILAHHDDRFGWMVSVWDMAGVVLTYAGLFYARSPLVVGAVAFLQIANVFVELPTTMNHWLVTAAASSVLLAALSYRAWRDRRLRPIDEAFFTLVAPPLRWIALLVYGFAFFHKLNTGYFDPAGSCAVDFYRRFSEVPLFFSLPLDPSPAMRYALIYGGIAVEGLIPLLLWGRKTWFYGLVLGGVFHLSIGLLFRHFSMLMFALNILFVPAGTFTGLIGRFEEWARRASFGVLGLVGVIRLQAFVWTAVFMGVWARSELSGLDSFSLESGYYQALRAWDLAAALILGAGAWILGPRRRTLGDARMLSTRWPWLNAAGVVLALNCLAPYYGLKDRAVLAMYSNLNTSGGGSNHFLMPGKAFKIFPYLDDMATIRETNVDAWRVWLSEGYDRVSFVMLQRDVRHLAIWGRKEISLRYERGGREFDWMRAEDVPELVTREPYWRKKLVYVRDARSDGKNICRW